MEKQLFMQDYYLFLWYHLSMKYKVLIAMLLTPYLLFATSFDTIIGSAEENGYQAERAKLQYESGLIALEQAELEDRTDYSISFQLEPLQENNEIISVSDLSFSVALPDDDTTISASLPFSTRYDASGALISPSVSVEHVFDWGMDDDGLKELQNASSRLSVNREYSSDMLSLRASIINSISSLLSNEKSLKEEEENLRDLQRSLSSSLKLGDISEDSILYMEAMLSIKRSEDTIKILNDEKNELEKQFMSLTGLTWDGVEDIPQPVFPDILSIDTSSELEESDLYARIAEEEYLLELSQQNPKKLSVGATADSDRYLGEGLNVNPSLEKNNIGVLGEIGWEGRNWNLGLSGGGTWDEDYSFTPVLTISGTWHSDSSSESDELTLRSLQNTATLRRGEYLDLRRSFEEESLDFWNRILSWERSSAELDAEMDYQTALLEYTKVRYERGLIPDEDLHDAEFELELLEIDRSVLLLEGLSLETEINMHIL